MEEKYNKVIGNRIKLLRKQKLISKKEIAKLLNVSVQQIDKYETGVNRISAAKLLILLNEYNIKDYKIFINDNIIDDSSSNNSISDKQRKNNDDIKLLFYYSKIKDTDVKNSLLKLIKIISKENTEDTEDTSDN